MATVNDTEFSDIYIIPDGTAYIWGRKTPSGLVQVQPDDYDEFFFNKYGNKIEKELFNEYKMLTGKK